MKRILKLFPVALAVFALASCSNDDLLGEKGGYTTSEKGDLIVEVEPFDNTTRALRDADGGSLTFENGDGFKVYDEQLYKYDFYEFKDDAFYIKGSKDIQVPKYGLFPSENVVRGYYDKALGKTVGEFAIPQVFSYDAASEKKVGDKVLYAANLPMFGIASLNGSKVYVSKLRHLVSVLKLDLENVKNNATFLKLSANKPLTGTFLAELDASSDEARKAVALKVGQSDLIVNNEMYIDLTTMPNREGVLYIPIIPGYEANKVAMKLEYTDNAVVKTNTIVDQDKAGAVVWKNTGLNFPKEVFGVNQLKEASWTFELTDMTPAKVTQLLAAYKTSEVDIDFELADKFTIGVDGSAEENTIAIPQLNKGVNVTLSLGEKFGTTAGNGWINAAPTVLEIVDADPAKPFKGTFTLEVDDILAAANIKNPGDLFINLPEATVQLVGDFATADILSGGAGTLTIAQAKKVIFGDDTYAPTADEITGGTYYKTIVTPAAITTTENVKAIEIAKYTLYNGNIDENYVAGPPATVSLPVDFELTVKGKLNGFVDLGHLFGAELNVESNFAYVPAANAAQNTAIFGNVTTGGDVTIALGSEGEAIGGTLTMQGARSDIDLVQGYVNTITANILNNGEWEEYRYVNLNLNNTNQGRVAFKNLTETANGDIFVVTESVWDGNKISDLVYPASGNNYYDSFTTFTEWDGEALLPAVNNTIFTASQFASFNGIGSAALLSNDLDMNNKPWTGYAVKTTFDGQEYTISNLALKAGAGLFASTTGAFTIENLTIDGVTVPSATEGSNVGGLLATTANDVTANKLTITNIAIDNGGTKALSNVGGLIGELTAGTVTLTDVYVDGSIKGYSALGGLIGKVSGGSIAATASKYSAVVAVTNNYKIGTELDMPLAMIGGFVGTTAVNLVFTAPKAQPTAPVHTYPAFEKMSDINALSGNLVSYTAEQNFVGFSGQKAWKDPKAAPVNVKVDKTTYYVSPTSKDKTVAEWKADGTTAGFGNNEACMYTVK